ncbi:MAG: extracellular solute-binding protein [Anaerolineales bacterium]|nr:extracellular solute-binding protein [Anaerolineales bacterium]
MKRHWMLICLTVALALILAACGGEPQTTAPTEQQEQTSAEPQEEAGETAAEETQEEAGPVELTFFHPSYGPEMDAFWRGIVDSFNQTNDSNITVELSMIDEETYKTKLPIDLRSSDAPDIYFQWEGGQLAFTVRNGFGADLGPYYEQYGWEDFLNPGAVSVSSLDGAKYLACYNMTAFTFFYNKAVFEQYKIAVPETWDDLLAAAQTLKDNGVAPFGLGNSQKWPAQFPWTNLLIHKYGIEVWEQLANNQIPWTDERVVDAFAMMQDLVNQGFYLQGVNAMDYSDVVIPIINGEAAMLMYMGSFAARRFAGDDGQLLGDFGVFTWPVMNSDVGSIPQVFCESSVMINANSEYKDQAAQFVNYILSTENQTAFMEIGGGIAANQNADYSLLSPLVQDQLAIIRNGPPVSFMPVDHQLDPSISSEYLDALQGVLSGITTPQQAAEMVDAASVEFWSEIE